MASLKKFIIPDCRLYIRITLLLLMFSWSITGCSGLPLWGTSNSTPSPAAQSADLTNSMAGGSVELYLSRASMTGGEFETYKVIDSQLFVECGRFQRGRHIPTFDELIDLKAERRAEIDSLVHELQPSAATGTGFSEAGKSTTMFDPGQAKLIVRNGGETMEVSTSVDALATPSSVGERRFRDLAVTLRGAPGMVLCNNLNFYGLGRQ